MPHQETCFNPQTGRGKVKYKTRAAAEKAARRTGSGLALRIYRCPFGDHFHLTSQEQRKVEVIPSAAKLRRKAANAAAQITAGFRKLRAVEAVEAAQRVKEHQRAMAAERDRQEVERYLKSVTERYTANRTPRKVLIEGF